MARFFRREEGGISVLSLLMLPVFLIVLALGLDFVLLNANRKHVQSQADLAAISGALNLESRAESMEAIRASVAVNDFFEAGRVHDDDIAFGTFATSGSFTPLSDAVIDHSPHLVEGVRVDVTGDAPFSLLSRYLDVDGFAFSRSATAIRQPRVSFALSNCLLSLELYKQALAGIAGLDTDVLCSGEGVRVNAVELFSALAVEGDALNYSSTYGDVLDAEFEVSELLSAVLGRSVPPIGDTLRLGDMIYMPSDLRRLTIGSPIDGIEISAADLVFGAVELLGDRLLDAALEIDLEPQGRVSAHLHVGEPRKIVVGARPGDPNARARTSQISLLIEGSDLLSLTGLKLKVEIASAEAQLAAKSEVCSRDTNRIAVHFDPVQVDLVDIGVSLSTPLLPISVTDLTAYVPLLGRERKEALRFSQDEIDRGARKEVAYMRVNDLQKLKKELEESLSAILQQELLTSGLFSGSTPVSFFKKRENSEKEILSRSLLNLALVPSYLEVLNIDCDVQLVE
ncbi:MULTISPECIES: pilus assembly protein TadG-related protein [unclassified Roseivivax]|uniref:pilus assembly protein TadG-related protein n=1 Tax=unclassified Roseivivax TaxID=2639302 RepID=UPI001561F255|nr:MULTISPECIES: pilus assembly protein TadG-related protein [unclassified Roseivivax]